MRHYQHLTLLERENILFLSATGYSITQIAKKMNRNKSTISREFHRNSSIGGYIPVKAQKRYTNRRKACKPHKRLEDTTLMDTVKRLFLDHQWSPEEIEGRLTLEYHHKVISYVTIYRAIYAGELDDKPLSHGNRGVIRKLRHHGKSRHVKGYVERRGKIRISHDISERPVGAEHRSRRGHWEADTITGITGKACLVTLVDRKSRYLLGGKAGKKAAAEVNDVMIRKLKGQPLHSITPDRGTEFAKHAAVTAVLNGVQFYFPSPHHPWQRGTNENTNGLLREYFPKGKDLTTVRDEYIQQQINELNQRPRKCLGYRTPYEVYFSKMLHLV